MPLLPSSNSAPILTEKNLPDQSNKVFIITGGNRGIGYELAKILYAHNGTVYIAGRSKDSIYRVISTIKSTFPKSTGRLGDLYLDLSDLTTIKASAQDFLAKEVRLDVLFNNAGVMCPPQGSLTAQGYELQLGTNCLGAFLFTKLLASVLSATARVHGGTRVLWLSSSAAERFSPPGGVVMNNLNYEDDKSAWHKYGVSKAGNILYGAEFAQRNAKSGVLSISLDPGNLKTGLFDNIGMVKKAVLSVLALHDPIYGAYTMLYAGFSTDLDATNNGVFVVPWGKIKEARKDIAVACKSEADGGTGVAKQFWDWSEMQVAKYL